MCIDEMEKDHANSSKASTMLKRMESSAGETDQRMQGIVFSDKKDYHSTEERYFHNGNYVTRKNQVYEGKRC